MTTSIRKCFRCQPIMLAVVAIMGGCNALTSKPDADDSDGPTGSPLPTENRRPVAQVADSIEALVGEPVTLNASNSYDPDGEIISFVWVLSDGTTLEGEVVDFTFDEPAQFEVTLTITDDLGATTSTTIQVVVAEQPTAEPEAFALTVTLDPPEAGAVLLDPPGGVYPEGQIVTVTIDPGVGFAFDGFEGDVISEDNPIEIVMDSDKVLTANLSLIQVTLTVDIEPPRAGEVTLDPPGGGYLEGHIVTVTIHAGEGYAFDGFEGDVISEDNPIEIVVDRDKRLTANLSLIQVTLTVDIEPPGAGEVTLDPEGGVYDFGTAVELTATAFAGFEFEAMVDESGATLGTVDAIDFILQSDLHIIAVFRSVAPPPPPPPPPPATFTLTTIATPPNGGIVELDPPGGVYAQDTLVTITAIPAGGYGFAQFSGDAGGLDPVTTVLMDRDLVVTAEFVWTPAIGNPGNLLVTGFVGKNVSEFDRFDGANLGEIVAEGAGGLGFAAGIDIGPDGDLFVVNIGLVSDTSVLRYDGETGTPLGEFVTGPGLIGFITLRFAPNGNLLVANNDTDTIEEYEGNSGVFVRTFVAAGSGGLDNPLGMAFGPSGNLFVVSKDSNSVLEYHGTTGASVGVVVDFDEFGFSVPVDLVLGPDGALYVSTSGNERVVRVDVIAGVAEEFVAAGAGGLDSPGGLHFHPDTSNLLVVSQGTNSVLEYDGNTGEFMGVFASGSDGDSLFFMTFRTP